MNQYHYDMSYNRFSVVICYMMCKILLETVDSTCLRKPDNSSLLSSREVDTEKPCYTVVVLQVSLRPGAAHNVRIF